MTLGWCLIMDEHVLGFLCVLGTHTNIQERRQKAELHSQWHEQPQRWMQCRKWFHGSSMEGMMGATHEWILSILEVHDKGLIKAWLGGSWSFMIKKAHDLVRSCIRSRTLREGLILVDLTHPYGMEVRGHSLDNDPWWIMVCVGSDHGCTGCKSKIDRVHWDMVPWPVRYKRAVRVDGELVEATSQLYQLEESDGTSSEVVQLS
ncbi:hypothetical protein F2Q68_00039705 [Brassica cretica]|uniref:Uncharacterized protein n=1 Tax=Brassica cretica TaxID=69181 RepID=A0A8S9MQQ2_BRACR|nr:hypothetical protein F2Q68_00039705 [Brassica cretica]